MASSGDAKGWLVGILILSVFVLAFLVLKPIIISIIFGLLFSYIFSPVYKTIYEKTGRKNLSALLLMIGLLIIITIPIIYIVPILVNQVFETYVLFQNFDIGGYFSNFVQSDLSVALGRNVDNIVGQAFSGLLKQFTVMLVNLPSLLLQLAVFLFTFYFAVRDAEELKKYICSLSPFSTSTEKKFLKEFRGITNAIVFGQVFIGIIQGLAVGVGLFFLGVPKVIALTFIACLLSIIPVLGSWIVWFPISIFLLVTGQTFSGAFLFLYGALFVSTIDNIFRPYILSKQSNLPVALSVIGTIGGLYFFGIAGLVLGPLILAYVLIIMEFYRQGKLKDLFSK